MRRSDLIGRSAEVDALTELVLTSEGRVVTIAAGGGVGKTSLAWEVARRLTPSFADAVWVVDLALRPPGDGVEGVAFECQRALGLAGLDDPLPGIVERLAGTTALLVFDNCEHVAAAAANLVDDLLDGCRAVRVLATSRVPLRVHGEVVFRLDPLAVPAGGRTHSTATELFMRRAGALGVGLPADAATAASVAAICRRLDGIPLAIELAAARTSGLSVAEIEARLGADEGLLASRSATLADRQRTIDAAVDWSYQLLTPEQQALFRGLGVFAGGWSLDAAEAVGRAVDPAIPVAATVAELVDHSLVVRQAPEGGDGDGADTDTATATLRLLAPVAESARARLLAAGEWQALAAAHAAYYLEAVERCPAGPRHASPDDIARMASVHVESRAALARARAGGDVLLAARLTVTLWGFWRVRGHLGLGYSEVAATLRLVEAPGTDPLGVAAAARRARAVDRASRRGDGPCGRGDGGEPRRWRSSAGVRGPRVDRQRLGGHRAARPSAAFLRRSVAGVPPRQGAA